MQYYGKMDPQQFALRGHSTTDALLFMLQAIYEIVDCAYLRPGSVLGWVSLLNSTVSDIHNFLWITTRD